MSTDAKVKKRTREVDIEEERHKRLVKAALNETLARKQCPRCASVGAWELYNIERTAGRVRYIRCLACGHCDQVPVLVKENDDEASDGEA